MIRFIASAIIFACFATCAISQDDVDSFRLGNKVIMLGDPIGIALDKLGEPDNLIDRINGFGATVEYAYVWDKVQRKRLRIVTTLNGTVIRIIRY